jgi:hypothetical protein
MKVRFCVGSILPRACKQNMHHVSYKSWHKGLFIANLVASLIRWALDVFEHENELLELFGFLPICFIVMFFLQVNSMSSSKKNIINFFAIYFN